MCVCVGRGGEREAGRVRRERKELKEGDEGGGREVRWCVERGQGGDLYVGGGCCVCLGGRSERFMLSVRGGGGSSGA